MKHLDLLLNGQGTSHILPFMWMHGEDRQDILEEIEKIEACGIRELCLEARPHPDFAGEHWWRDVDLIMDECRKRNMRVWILDDDHFPTGHANGAYSNKYQEKAKWYLGEHHMDFSGSAGEVSVLVSSVLPENSRILGILAYSLPSPDMLSLYPEGSIDLTEKLKNGFVTFDLAPGNYRLFTFFVTQTGGGRPNYMNIIDSDSVRVLIDEVYEPHYRRYKNDFGKTFAGFFSDEPEFGNTPGYCFDDVLGKPKVYLPWSGELEEALKKRWKDGFRINLAGLWYDFEGKTAFVRYTYMDEATKLVHSCFSGQLGNWCRERGVEYIGHIIEDNNSHARLGCSIGHYFREMKGQAIAGVDVVHHQIIPGFTGFVHKWVAGDGDGEFFHFCLAKLGSSSAAIDPEKKGRALCEVFGNYGWATGTALMKWLTDHMLVRGINYFVPHAFSPRYPEYDCPPHFYALGHNPQYRFFSILMKYMNRMAHILEGGKRRPEAAVLYHGESEWAGGKTMLCQKPIRCLMEHQLDCDIIPSDVFADKEFSFSDTRLCINKTTYGSIIVPCFDYIVLEAAVGIAEAAKKGIPVFFVDQRPGKDTLMNPVPEEFASCGTVVSLDDLAETVQKAVPQAVSIKGEFPELRLYSVSREDGLIIMLFNEHHFNRASFEVRFPGNTYSRLIRYDGIANKTESWKIENGSFPVTLDPGEAALYILDRQKENKTLPVLSDSISLECEWTFSISPENDNNFATKASFKANGLPNLHKDDSLSDFAGVLRYEGRFAVKDNFNRCMLYFPRISDCAAVAVNGSEAGTVLGNSGRVDITAFVKQGQNCLSIETATTLVRKIKDPISCYMGIGPLGMTKTPVLEYYS
jgi:hypothetical protein